MTRSFMRPMAVAALLALAGTAQAQLQMQINGLLDLSGGRFQASGANRVWRVESGAMTPSQIGVRGSDDLGGGLRARFAIEHELRADSGQSGRFAGDAFWNRAAYVGLAGAFGTTVLGRSMTPLYVATTQFNAFGESPAFSPSVRQVFTPSLLPFFGDIAWDNAMSYTSTGEDDITYRVMANLGEGAAGAGGTNLGGSITYLRGPLAAVGVWQRVRNGLGLSIDSPFGAAPPGFGEQETWQLGASYEINSLKLYGQYSHVHTKAAADTTTKLWGVGASLSLGLGRVLVQYGSAEAHVGALEPRHRSLAVGYDYDLSRRTDVYAAWMADKIGGQGRGNTVAGGVRLRF